MCSSDLHPTNDVLNYIVGTTPLFTGGTDATRSTIFEDDRQTHSAIECYAIEEEDKLAVSSSSTREEGKKRPTCQSKLKMNEDEKRCETDSKSSFMCLANQNGNNNLTTRGQRAARRDQQREQREIEAMRQQTLDDLEMNELTQRELESIKTENVLSAKVKEWMAEQQKGEIGRAHV